MSRFKAALDLEAEIIEDRVWDWIAVEAEIERDEAFVFGEMIELALCDFAGHAFEGADVDDAVDFAIFVGMKWRADCEDFLADEVFA